MDASTPRARGRTSRLPALLLAVAVGSEAAAEDAPPPRRLSAQELECPPEAEPRWGESAAGRRAVWCEAQDGSGWLRHGPYLELFEDGTTARQGVYSRGLQAGRWVRWSAAGEIERDAVIWPGEAGRHLAEPEDLCPPGTARERATGYDDRERLWSRCHGRDEHGERVLEGPYVTWDAERSARGVRYMLRELVTYRAGERHGPRRVFEGASGEEALVEEESYVDGLLDGESRAYYVDGTPRELRVYRQGAFEGERIGFYPGGGERWRLTYEDGRRIAAEGDLSVAGQPCPGDTVPTFSADALEEACARRRLHSLERNGPFVVRDAAGSVVESGLYRRDRKVELWQTSGAELPLQVSEDVMVAEGILLIGGRVYTELRSPPARVDAWRSVAIAAEEPPSAQPRDPGDQGAPGSEAGGIDSRIWFRDEATGHFASARKVIDGGRVEIYGLSPGRYYMGIHIDAAPANPMQYPGDLTAGARFEVELGRVTSFDVELLRTLHLTEPFDNQSPIPGWDNPCGEKAELPPRVRFAWRPPAGEDPAGLVYEYRLRRFSCEPFRRREVVAEGRTPQTALEIELEPSGRAQGYEFELFAWRGEQRLGHLMSFGERGYGWSLRFRVR